MCLRQQSRGLKEYVSFPESFFMVPPKFKLLKESTASASLPLRQNCGVLTSKPPDASYAALSSSSTNCWRSKKGEEGSILSTLSNLHAMDLMLQPGQGFITAQSIIFAQCEQGLKFCGETTHSSCFICLLLSSKSIIALMRIFPEIRSAFLCLSYRLFCLSEASSFSTIPREFAVSSGKAGIDQMIHSTKGSLLHHKIPCFITRSELPM